MSQNCSVDFYLDDGAFFDLEVFLDSIEKVGWGYNDHGKVNYMTPEHDWLSAELDQVLDVKKYILDNHNSGQIFSICLIYNATNIGVSLMYIEDNEDKIVSFSVNINPKKLNNKNFSRYTDTTWYINKLFPAFIEANVGVKGIETSDYYC